MHQVCCSDRTSANINLGFNSGFGAPPGDGPPGGSEQVEWQTLEPQTLKPTVDPLDPLEQAYIATNELCKTTWVKAEVYYCGKTLNIEPIVDLQNRVQNTLTIWCV